MKVKVKALISNELGWMPFLTAIDLWVNRDSIDIAREPDLAEYENDAEREQALRIVKGIWNLKESIPTIKYAIEADALDRAEEAFVQIALKPVFESNGNGWLAKDELLRLAIGQHPEFRGMKDPERRLRSLAHKKALYKENRPDTVYYRMNPYYKSEREVTATA